MTLTNAPSDPWGNRRTTLKIGELVRFVPNGLVYVVGYVNNSRARVHPLTPIDRVIHVPDPNDRLNKRKRIEKEVQQTGDAIDISPTSIPEERLTVEGLNDQEFKRLTWYIESGGEFELTEGD